MKYLNAIGYPLDVNNKTITVDWLLTIALRYDIEDISLYLCLKIEVYQLIVCYY